MVMKIMYVGEHISLAFAAAELKRVLEQMDTSIEIALCSMQAKGTGIGFWLGTFDALALEKPQNVRTEIDDGYLITAKGVTGLIAGTNPRSVLLGVYRYLRELGCAWIRPGALGEIVPKVDVGSSEVRVSETASYRHRGVCIEGATSYDHVAEMVKWLPKIGMNAYFNQFRTPYTFYDRWYNHIDNPMLAPEPISIEEVDGFVRSQMTHIQNSNMLYHATGHGWTCSPLNLDSYGWYSYDKELPEGVEELLALVNGKRQLHEGIPLNTNLCYTNPLVREKIISAIIEYCVKHREVDYLHFWLADAMNVHCECSECIKKRPSDNYVDMLNDLDTRMTEAGVTTRVVFLIYFDLLWSPQTSKIQNSERFVLMFAPISRTYTTAYLDNKMDDSMGEAFPFAYNKLSLPRSVSENVAYLRGWQKNFQGDSFVFDYHLWRDHLRDIGYAQISQVLFKDMQGLKQLGLNGMISCQAQRVFFPSALPMLLMADALWDDRIDYETSVEYHYREMFGTAAPQVRDYLEQVSLLFDSSYLRHEKSEVSEETQRNYEKASTLIRNFLPIIEKNLDLSVLMHPAIRHSFVILKHHAELALLLANALKHKAAGDKQSMESAWKKTAAYAKEHEMDLHDVFDVYEFQAVVGESLNKTQWGW